MELFMVISGTLAVFFAGLNAGLSFSKRKSKEELDHELELRRTDYRMKFEAENLAFRRLVAQAVLCKLVDSGKVATIEDATERAAKTANLLAEQIGS